MKKIFFSIFNQKRTELLGLQATIDCDNAGVQLFDKIRVQSKVECSRNAKQLFILQRAFTLPFKMSLNLARKMSKIIVFIIDFETISLLKCYRNVI